MNEAVSGTSPHQRGYEIPKSRSEKLPPQPLRILEVFLGQKLVDSYNLKGNSASSGLALDTDRSAPQETDLREAGQKSLQSASLARLDA